MTDIHEIARALWRESRDRIQQQADEAVDAARAWSDSHDDTDLEAVRSLAHQLTGALGTYAAALRTGVPGDEAAEQAAGAAVRLDEVAQMGAPVPASVS